MGRLGFRFLPYNRSGRLQISGISLPSPLPWNLCHPLSNMRRYCLKRRSGKEGGKDGTILESPGKDPVLILVDKGGSQRRSEREAASDGKSCERNSSEYSPAYS